MMKRVLLKLNIPVFITALWAVVYFINMLTTKNALIGGVHDYIFVIACFWATAQTLHKAIKTHDIPYITYGALGFCCLALGYFYFLLLNIISSMPDYVSIGNFSSVCCYLFFLSALMGLKETRSPRYKVFYLMANIFSVVAAITGVCAVILNNVTAFNTTIVLLDVLCIAAAASLLISKNKKAAFFAVMMLITAISDIVGGFGFVAVISLLIGAFAPVIYLLLSRSLILIKEGD